MTIFNIYFAAYWVKNQRSVTITNFLYFFLFFFYFNFLFIVLVQKANPCLIISTFKPSHSVGPFCHLHAKYSSAILYISLEYYGT